MSDFISRQAAIEALDFKTVYMTGVSNDEKNITNPFAQYNKGLEDGIKAIRDLPSADPEQKGKWLRRKGKDCWECSECHAVLENSDVGNHNFYYCYHCGANMMDKSGYMDIEEVYYG